MAVNDTLFVTVPIIALLLNLFLLLICVSAKKNKLIRAFMMLTIAFSLWTGGSAGMRAMFYPGTWFWYEVSLIGVFSTPFLLYNFLHHYTENKGSFTRTVLGVSWLLVIILSIGDVFMTSPEVTAMDGSRTFSYEMTIWAAFPLLLVLITLFLIVRLVYQAVKRQDVLAGSLRPVLIGALIMFLGVLSSALLDAKSFPIDPLSCGINALFLFYALYKKRLITFKMITSRGPLYLAAGVMTALLLAVVYPSMDRLYKQALPEYLEEQTIVIAMFVSLLTVLVYNLLRIMMSRLFARGHRLREDELRRFSLGINESLDTQQILKTFSEFIDRNIDCDVAYICAREEGGDFVTKVNTKPVAAGKLTIRGDSPLITLLEEHNQAISFHDLARTRYFRSMWDSEKELLRSHNIRFLLPITEGGRLIAVTLLADADNQTVCSPSDAILLESAAAVMSIAARNAMLYSAMQDEAHHDGLTGLPNRRHFMELARQLFEKSAKGSFTAAIISLDDFQLYNELYGSFRGDQILQDFSKMLLSALGNLGEAGRYGGKEFILALPNKDSSSVSDLVNLVRNMLKEYLKKNRNENYGFLTFSAGICSYPSSASTLEDVVHFAGIAVYAAKKKGKNRTQLYREVQTDKPEAKESREFNEQSAQTIYALAAAVDAKDHYTFNHSENVSIYASQLAEVIGLDREYVEIIGHAGLLHDIGKIGIPESILGKQGPLTEEEREIMQRHVEGSIAMIKYLPNLDYVTPVAIGHHERWDGKGYPRGLVGDENPIGARCLCIADAFDAMTTDRIYKKALSLEAALDEIKRGLGTQFDPKIGLAFIKAIEEGKIKPLRK